MDSNNNHGNRQEGPPHWQAEYDLMNVASCAPDKLPICLLGVTTSLPSGKRNADGTPHMEEYAAVITSEPCGTKKEALNYCFHLVHDALIPFGLDTMVSQDEKSLSLVALERQNANASKADKKCNPMSNIKHQYFWIQLKQTPLIFTAPGYCQEHFLSNCQSVPYRFKNCT